MDPSHRQFLLKRRAADRERCAAAFAVVSDLGDQIMVLNERIANGKAYVADHPGDREAANLLAKLRRERSALEADCAAALYAYRQIEESYLMSVGECRIHGLPEEGADAS
jgi:hypothetical protein